MAAELYEIDGFEVTACDFDWITIRFPDGKTYRISWNGITYSQRHNSILMPLSKARQMGLECG